MSQVEILKPVTAIRYGADPELFVERDGKVIGSEKVIPEEGLMKRVIRDGVQVELNPAPQVTVGLLGMELSRCFRQLDHHLLSHPGVSACFTQVVDVGREELDSLSEKSRILGCQPSKNVYGVKPITVDAEKYTKRSLGGHMHFGLGELPFLFQNHSDLVSPMDIFVGNTLVLLDRDPLQAERRENYGRAGEYRTQPHGLEYRTPSSFWLRNYTLMSLAYGLADIALSVVYHRLTGVDIEAELIDVVNIDNFITAINKNDFDLARENFDTIRPFLVKHLPRHGFVLNPSNIDKFLVLIDGVKEKGISGFFPRYPVYAWTDGRQIEFSLFLQSVY